MDEVCNRCIACCTWSHGEKGSGSKGVQVNNADELSYAIHDKCH